MPNRVVLPVFVVLTVFYFSILGINSPAYSQENLYRKGVSAFDAGQYTEALDSLFSALKKENPDRATQSDIHLRMAYIYIRLNQKVLAERSIENLLKVDPHFNPALKPALATPAFMDIYNPVRSRFDLVQFRSTPSGAEVIAEGKSVGLTPVDTLIPAGTAIEVQFRMKDYLAKKNIYYTRTGNTVIVVEEKLDPVVVAPIVVAPPPLPKPVPENKIPEAPKETAKPKPVKKAPEEPIEKPKPEPAKKSELQKVAENDETRVDRIVGYSLAGASGASFIASAVFYMRASDYAEKAGNESDKDTYDDDVRSGKNALTVSYVCAGVGLAAGAAAAYYLYKGYSKPMKVGSVEIQQSLSFNPSSNGLSVGIGGSFR